MRADEAYRQPSNGGRAPRPAGRTPVAIRRSRSMGGTPMTAVHERTIARAAGEDTADGADRLEDADRYAIERAKWDAHAATIDDPIEGAPPGEDFGSYVRRQKLLPGVAEFLGDLQGKEVIEYG